MKLTDFAAEWVYT